MKDAQILIDAMRERIKQLNSADAAFCQDRWDKSLPDYRRQLAREESNKVTFARQELQYLIALHADITKNLSRMKDAQILIDALNEIRKTFPAGTWQLRTITQALASYNASDVPDTGMRWVKASERLPKKSGRYRCKLLIGERMSGEYIYKFDADTKEFCDEVAILHTGSVIWLDRSPNSEQEVL